MVERKKIKSKTEEKKKKKEPRKKIAKEKPIKAVKKEKVAPAKEEIKEKPEEKKPPKNYIYAVGRRKEAVARVRLFKNGEGKVIINEKGYSDYFPFFEFKQIVLQPLKAIGQEKGYNISIKVKGGGVRGQAEACRHGITRALVKINENFKRTLKPLGFLTRDSREKERKKPGLKSARRAPQWQKR